jgi:hypothetical protein
MVCASMLPRYRYILRIRRRESGQGTDKSHRPVHICAMCLAMGTDDSTGVPHTRVIIRVGSGRGGRWERYFPAYVMPPLPVKTEQSQPPSVICISLGIHRKKINKDAWLYLPRGGYRARRKTPARVLMARDSRTRTGGHVR